MTLAGLYNLRQVFSHVPKIWGTFFDLKKQMNPSASFCHSELRRALEEQAFGIKKFTISSSSAQQAVASIVLLEGIKLTVELTTQGYYVSGTRTLVRVFNFLTLNHPFQIVTTSNIYETVEDLLQAASPMYVKKRQELLYAKLAKISP